MLEENKSESVYTCEKDNAIKKIIIMYRKIESDIIMFKALNINRNTFEKRKRQKQIIDSWLYLLNEYERWIVKVHLISGLSWPLVVNEFEKKWGKEQARDERTLKRVQAKAINKIKNNVEKNGLESSIKNLFYELL